MLINLSVVTFLKIIRGYKLKCKFKSWITLGLQKSIFETKKLIAQLINNKDPLLKKHNIKFRTYRHLHTTLPKNNDKYNKS